jgi:hypothetical protein
MTTLLDLALKYAARGLRVFPCKPAGKAPATTHGVKDATLDANKITAWWTAQPTCNIAVATGGGMLVVDVDSLDAEAELRQLETRFGALPPTIEAITAKGRHIYLRYPQTRNVRNSTSKVAAGIDVRANGGFVIAPPSLHPSGKRYCWSVDSSSALAEAPAWLLDLIEAPWAHAPGIKAPAGTEGVDWADFIRDGVSEGSRNEDMAKFVGMLLTRFDVLVAEQMALAVNDARFRPPLSSTEVETIIDSIAKRELQRRRAL